MKKHIIILSIIIIIDIFILYSWVLYLNPDSSVGIYMVFIAPFLFLLNLIIAFVFYFIKKYYVRFFIINAFLSTIIMHFLFVWKTKENNYGWEYWEFSVEGTNYNISRNGSEAEFFITFEDKLLGGSWGLENDRGSTQVKGDTIYFIPIEGPEFYIYKGYIYGFMGTNKIKIER